MRLLSVFLYTIIMYNRKTTPGPERTPAPEPAPIKPETPADEACREMFAAMRKARTVWRRDPDAIRFDVDDPTPIRRAMREICEITCETSAAV